MKKINLKFDFDSSLTCYNLEQKSTIYNLIEIKKKIDSNTIKKIVQKFRWRIYQETQVLFSLFHVPIFLRKKDPQILGICSYCQIWIWMHAGISKEP